MPLQFKRRHAVGGAVAGTMAKPGLWHTGVSQRVPEPKITFQVHAQGLGPRLTRPALAKVAARAIGQWGDTGCEGER